MTLVQFAIPTAFVGSAIALLALVPSAWVRFTRALRREPRLGEPEAIALADDIADLAKLVEEIEQTALRQNAALADRLASLEQVIAALRRSTETPSFPRGIRPDTRCQTARDFADAAQGPNDVCPLLSSPSAARNSAATSVASSLRRFVASNPNHDSIYALADQNVPPGEIARRTNLAIGEVEVILGLRKLGIDAAA